MTVGSVRVISTRCFARPALHQHKLLLGPEPRTQSCDWLGLMLPSGSMWMGCDRRSGCAEGQGCVT